MQNCFPRWTSQVLGYRFISSDILYVCSGYDPEVGFCMQTLDGLDARYINISVDKIYNTFHKVNMTPEAWSLLEMSFKKGYLLSGEDKETQFIILELATKTLINNGLIEGTKLTPYALETLSKHSEDICHKIYYLDPH